MAAPVLRILAEQTGKAGISAKRRLEPERNHLHRHRYELLQKRIEHYWGVKPLEIYGGTEIGFAATQTWDYNGMILFPDVNFWEFIPEDEHFKSQADPNYEPRTVLFSQLEPGKRYELVVTNLKGGAFVRYRVGDMIKVLSRTNETLDIDLPQIIYEDRVEDVIDLAGFTGSLNGL